MERAENLELQGCEAGAMRAKSAFWKAPRKAASPMPGRAIPQEAGKLHRISGSLGPIEIATLYQQVK
jgi:hypothetical protein